MNHKLASSSSAAAITIYILCPCMSIIIVILPRPFPGGTDEKAAGSEQVGGIWPASVSLVRRLF